MVEVYIDDLWITEENLNQTKTIHELEEQLEACKQLLAANDRVNTNIAHN